MTHIERINLLLGVVGCITGVATFAWQAMTFTADRRELPQISVQIVPASIDSNRITAFKLEATVTNLGRSDIFVSKVSEAVSSPSEARIGDFAATDDARIPIAPGGFRSYTSPPVDAKTVCSWPAAYLTGRLSVQVATTRGTIVSTVGRILPGTISVHLECDPSIR